MVQVVGCNLVDDIPLLSGDLVRSGGHTFLWDTLNRLKL